MDTNELRAHIKKEIEHFDEDMLRLASMFIYNWTEGPWTPEPLTPEQIEKLEKRIDEAESGETYSTEEIFKVLEEKYGIVKDESEEYRVARLAELKHEVQNLLEYVGERDLTRLDIFLTSHSKKSNWGNPDIEEQGSLLRGIEDADAGRLTDLSVILEKYG